MSKKEETVPEGSVVRDDGCICPTPPAQPPCNKKKLPVCPYDPRFPNTNQTNHCFISFIDYQKCARLLGDYPGCMIFYYCYTTLCPSSWYESWYDKMENGTFPKKIYPPSPIIRPDPEKMKTICFEEEEPPEANVC